MAMARPAHAASVFVESTGNDFSATGFRVTISAPPWPPLANYDDFGYYIMENITLRNGEYLQVGWATLIEKRCRTNAFFAYALGPTGAELTFPIMCQASNATQTFRWELYQNLYSLHCWRAYVGSTVVRSSYGDDVGDVCLGSHDNGSRQPSLQAETPVGNDNRNSLGPSQFTEWAFRTDAYYRIQSAFYWRPADTPCPLYGGRTYGYNNVQLGSNSYCFYNGQVAWGS